MRNGAMSVTKSPAFAVAAAFCIASVTHCLAEKSDGAMQTYNRLLAKYVTASGVKYSEWKSDAADMQALQSVVDAIANEKISGSNQKEALAAYINAYNAWILHEALGKYPTKSVKDVLFAFYCASRSCPPLDPEAFRGDKLDAQLEKLARSFVNSEKGVNYSAEKKSAELSAIFEWYKDD